MANEVEITRKQVIVVGEVSQNSYGDLTFTDKEGKGYKVGAKRRQYFDIIQPGVAVQLNYAVYMKKEYIYNATQVTDAIPEQAPQLHSVQAPKPPPQATKSIPSLPQEKNREIAPVERGMWLKEMGNRIGDGSIDKDFPNTAVRIKAQYYKMMSDITGINFK